MSISEITEEKDEEASPFIDRGPQKERIRRILEHQKSLYWSSSSSSSPSSSSSASCSSFSSSRKSSSLLDLMEGGNTSLRRLFDMEHTSLAKYFEYGGSPIIKPIPLWASDSDYEAPDPWASIRQFGAIHDPRTDAQSKLASKGSFKDKEFGFGNRKVKHSNRKLR